MKNQVLNHFKQLPKSPEQQYNEAFQLYRKCPGKSLGQERFYNAAGFSPANLENLHYDLKKLLSITEAEIRRTPIEKVVKVPEKVVINQEDLDAYNFEKITSFLTQEKINFPTMPNFDKGLKGNKQMKDWLLNNGVETTFKKKADLLASVETFIEKTIYNLAADFLSASIELDKALNTKSEKHISVATSKEEVFTSAPDEVKAAVKLRDEFPFLNEKDCPEEFLVLVGKKLQHYHAYVAAHQSLLVNIKDVNEDASPIAMTNEEVAALALEAVADFQLNQDIYDELTHYKETGKILGKHVIFKEINLKAKVDALTVETATKRIANLDNYIRRDKNKAEKSKTAEDKAKFLDKVQNWEIELRLIKAKFNFSETK